MMPRTSITRSSYDQEDSFLGGPVSGRRLLRFRTGKRIGRYLRRYQYGNELLRPRHKAGVRHRRRRGSDRRHQSLQQVQLRRFGYLEDGGLVVRGMYLPDRRRNDSAFVLPVIRQPENLWNTVSTRESVRAWSSRG